MNNPDFSPQGVPQDSPQGHLNQGDPRRATPGKVAAFFDLDKTIIAMSSTYAYGREFMNSGLISPVEALQLSLAQATYMLAGHTSEQMDNTRDQLTAMVSGWDVQQVRSIAEETMHTVVTRPAAPHTHPAAVIRPNLRNLGSCSTASSVMQIMANRAK